MKIHKIVLFIIGVLVGLSVICIFFPSEGIQVGGVKFEFPSLLSVLEAESYEEEAQLDTIQQLSPEELLERRMATLRTQKEDEFHQFASSSPQRIYLPGDDETYLDVFFHSLEIADSQHVRILHLGDSQIECDRISSSLREQYQLQFGGHGVGLVPALQTVPTYTLSQTISPSGTVGHYLVYGPSDLRAGHSRYGIMGQVNHVTDGTTIRFSVRDLSKHPCSGGIKRVTIYADQGEGMVLHTGTETVDFVTYPMSESCTVYSANISHATQSLTITIRGEHDIYGICLDDESGVSLDNVPMRGCSGTIFSQIDPNTLKPFFQHENVRLLILQYGGNSVPSCSGARGISNYMKSLRRQIRLFRRIAPEASILFVGPADMATRIGGEMKSYPILPEMVDSLREMSLQEGIAFWDMFSAMGGKGSIVKWYRAQPQLAGSDFVHFTPKGAQKMADMLYGTLQLYYRYYRLRTGKEDEGQMRGMKFSEAVAPVEGSSTILVSELPVSKNDSIHSDDDLEGEQGNEQFDEIPDRIESNQEERSSVSSEVAEN